MLLLISIVCTYIKVNELFLDIGKYDTCRERHITRAQRLSSYGRTNKPVWNYSTIYIPKYVVIYTHTNIYTYIHTHT